MTDEAALRIAVRRAGWILQFVAETDVRRCPTWYNAWLAGLDASASLGQNGEVQICLLSALLRGWNYGQSRALSYLLFSMQINSHIQVAGLPLVDNRRFWHWPARRLKQQYWQV